MDKRGLGKGLDALIPELGDKEVKDNINEVDINKLRSNPDQPRKNVSEEHLKELTDSIKEHGVLQPIIVRRIGDLYQIVAGERRWRAAKNAGLKKVPVIFKELSDSEVMQVALLENIQREDLNPMEKSNALNRLIDEYGLTQEKLSKVLGKSRSAIANILRLVNLEKKVQELVVEGLLSDGHARVLLSLSGELQIKVAQEVVDNSMSVRKTENYIKKLKRTGKKEDKKQDETDANDKRDQNNKFYYNELQDRLEKQLGTKVRILKGKKKGKIEIEFIKEDDLEKLTEALLKRN